MHTDTLVFQTCTDLHTLLLSYSMYTHACTHFLLRPLANNGEIATLFLLAVSPKRGTQRIRCRPERGAYVVNEILQYTAIVSAGGEGCGGE